ncbi:MAG: AMP-binding protein, partial [Pseudonocardiales bacterium]|nr:AMP-binding protein [Pseudonocardiales bacterium]
MTPSPLLPALLDPSDRPALRAGDHALTQADLAAVAAALGPRLAGARRVAVHAAPGIHTAVAVTAAVLAGVPAVPLNPKLGERELGHVLADA